jgi:hypothetical protein
MAINSIPQDSRDTNVEAMINDINAKGASTNKVLSKEEVEKGLKSGELITEEELRKRLKDPAYAAEKYHEALQKQFDPDKNNIIDKKEAENASKFLGNLKDSVSALNDEQKAHLLKKDPNIISRDLADYVERESGLKLKVSDEAAKVFTDTMRAAATGNGGGGAGNHEKDGQSKGLPGEKKDEKEAGKNPDFFDRIAKFLTAILSMLKGLNQEETDHAKNDMEGKAMVSGGKPPTSNEVAATAQKVAGDRLDVTKLSPDALEQVKFAGKAVRETGGSVDLQATHQERSSYVAAAKPQQAAGGLTA